MGDRGNIVLKQEPYSDIFLYTHWGGTDIAPLLKKALVRGHERWSDEPYLARIIFSEMVSDDIEGLTGYGLSPYQTDNEHPLLYVDLKQRKIHCNGNAWTYDEFVQEGDDRLRELCNDK